MSRSLVYPSAEITSRGPHHAEDRVSSSVSSYVYCNVDILLSLSLSRFLSSISLSLSSSLSSLSILSLSLLLIQWHRSHTGFLTIQRTSYAYCKCFWNVAILLSLSLLYLSFSLFSLSLLFFSCVSIGIGHKQRYSGPGKLSLYVSLAVCLFFSLCLSHFLSLLCLSLTYTHSLTLLLPLGCCCCWPLCRLLLRRPPVPVLQAESGLLR